MRLITCAGLVLLTACLCGCNRPIVSEPPARQQQSQQRALTPIPDEELRAVSAIKPGTKIDAEVEAEEDPEAEGIREAIQTFREACLSEDAAACLGLYTADAREQVAPWFETDEVFEVYGKSNQSLWFDDRGRDIVVRIGEIGETEASVQVYADLSMEDHPPGAMLQASIQPVALRKIDGRWLIDDPVLYPEQGLQMQQTSSSKPR